MWEWLTEKRKNILLNAGAFGAIAAAGALAEQFSSGKPIGLSTVQLAVGAGLGAIVGYLNSKKDELETGAKPGAGKVRIGF